MKVSPLPYAIAVTAGAAFGVTSVAFGEVAAVGLGLVLAAAFAFGPPMPGLRQERERIGRNASSHAVMAFVMFGLAVCAGLFIFPNRPPGPSLTPGERQIAGVLFWLMSWGLGIGAAAWGLFLVRPRKPKDGALTQKAD